LVSNKQVANKIKFKVIFLGYHLDFEEVCKRHLEKEFEIQIHDGKISVDSYQAIHKFSKDFDLHQVEKQVDIILVDGVSKYNRGNNLLPECRQN
jgi:hypothetical protein